MDYGAACNGTTNDYAAFASAITAAGTGGTVQFSGTCKINTGLTMLAGQTLQGVGRSSTLLKGANIHMILIDGVAGVTIRSLTLDGGYNWAGPSGWRER